MKPGKQMQDSGFNSGTDSKNRTKDSTAGLRAEKERDSGKLGWLSLSHFYHFHKPHKPRIF